MNIPRPLVIAVGSEDLPISPAVPHLAISRFCATIQAHRQHLPGNRAMIVGVTGIDGSGKGFVSARIRAGLEKLGFSASVLGADGWLNLPQVRFSREDPGGHFYRHGLRLNEMFQQVVLPLRRRRSLQVETDFAEETANEYRKQSYQFTDLDVLVVEGIFILKRAFVNCFDFSCWIDCSFETAMARAIARGQEGLSAAETIRAFETIYFPAQRIHFQEDGPRSAATFMICNDPRLNVVEQLKLNTSSRPLYQDD